MDGLAQHQRQAGPEERKGEGKVVREITLKGDEELMLVPIVKGG